jgi:hypothetical protein
MSKLHEVLAVETDLQGTAEKVRTECVNTFTKKANLFGGGNRVLKMFSEDRKNEEDGGRVDQPLNTTVDDKLNYIIEAQVKYFDCLAQKESTNQVAKADLVLDGVVVAKDLPATLLLGLESRLKAVRGVFETIPTLDPNVNWELADEQGKGVWKSAEPEVTRREEKVMKPVVLYPATDKHPAQVKESVENQTVGLYYTMKFSGMITPAKKSNYLERIDTLIQAVKQARQRANSTEVVNTPIGQQLFDYIMKG